MWSVKSGVESAKCGLRSREYGVRNAQCDLKRVLDGTHGDESVKCGVEIGL